MTSPHSQPALRKLRRATGRRGFSPRLEPLEDRTVLDAGDTLATALATGLGPAPGNYQMYVEFLGDGGQGARDVDLYRFAAPAGSILSARTSPGAFGVDMDPLVRLFDAAGNELGWNDNLATTRYGRIDFTFTTPGTNTYYLGVSGSPNDTYDPTTAGSGLAALEMGHYGLEMNLFTAPAVAPDVDDYTGGAAWTDIYGFFTANGFYASNLRLGDGAFTDADVDMFLVYAAAGTTLTVRTLAPHGAAPQVDTLVRLFDENAVEVARNDDGPGDHGLFSLLSFAVPRDGFYYVGVSGATNGLYDPLTLGTATPGDTGLYRLEILLGETPPAPVTDVGDSIFSATYLGTGGYVQVAQVLGDGPQTSRDVDLYSFVATAGQTLLALTSRSPGGAAADTILRLFDSNGFELALNDDGGTDFYSFLSYRFRTTDVYYLGVSGSANYVYRPFEDGSGVPGGAGSYTLDLFLFTGGAGPGAAPGPGGGSDLVFGLVRQGPAPAGELTARPSVREAGRVFQPEMRITSVAEIGRAESPRSEATNLLLEPQWVLDLVFGDLG